MTTYTIGNTSLGSNSDYYLQSANKKIATPFVNTTGSTVYVETIYLYYLSNLNNIKVKLFVFSGSAAPDQLLGITTEITSLVAGWNRVSLTSPLTVVANAKVWIGAITDTDLYHQRSTVTSTTVGNSNSYSSGVTTTFGTVTESQNVQIPIYMEGYSTPGNSQPRAIRNANMRILYDNAADRSTLTTSSTAGNLVASNMLNNHKSSIWRSTSTTATISVAFFMSELMGCIAIPFCNLTSTATIRVRGYADAAGSTLAFDTGTVPACPYSTLGSWQWGTQPLGLNAFSYGGGTYASVYTPIVAVRSLVIDLVDSANTLGYIDCSRLVAGSYWTPTYNPEYGASATSQDTSKQYRSDAGDLLTDAGTLNRKINLNLSKLTPNDRAAFWRVVRNVGMSRPVFTSIFPENADIELEQTHQIFGKIPTLGSVSASSYNIYSAPLEIEEI